MNQHSKTISVVLLLLYTMLRHICCASGNCSTVNAATVRLILQSQRNATGHRTLKVKLMTETLPGTSFFADQGGLEAIQEISRCDGVEFVSTTSIVTAPPARMPTPDYELFPGLGYYKMHTTPVTWDEAYHICVREGSLLMMPDSEAESFVVKQFLGRKLTITGPTWPQWLWAGFHDKGVEGEYLTVEGTKVKDGGYTKWHPGQPDNTPWGTEPDQDCGGISNTALMQDLPCLAKLPFICEQHL